ncbi:MAG TPA: hypothetical protein VGH88_06435 [Streptosporangiaceae bacterium]
MPPQPPQESPGTADVVKDQAADLKQSGVEAGQHTVGVAQEQVSEVAAEATRQGRDLLVRAQQQVGDQVAEGQQRLAAELLSLGDELSSMADGSEQKGTAASLARQAATRVRGVGQWLDDRSPAQLVDDLQAFARRKPGTFLALAVGAGLAAGRLTRGLTSAQSDDGDGAASTPRTGGQPGTAGAWAASTGTSLAEPTVGAGYPAPPAPAAPELAGPPVSPAVSYPDEADVVVADNGSAAVPVVDGLPATGAGSSWDVYPQADEQGTLGRHETGGGGTR